MALEWMAPFCSHNCSGMNIGQKVNCSGWPRFSIDDLPMNECKMIYRIAGLHYENESWARIAEQQSDDRPYVWWVAGMGRTPGIPMSDLMTLTYPALKGGGYGGRGWDMPEVETPIVATSAATTTRAENPTRAAATTTEAPPLLKTGYDVSAFLVPPGEAPNLQAALDKHKIVRLLNADYTPACVTVRTRHGAIRNCSFPEANLTVGTGQAIWGLPGTVIPGVIITPGSKSIVLSTLSFRGENSLIFPAGEATTRFNSFHRLQNVHVRFSTGSKVADCSFVGLTELMARSVSGGKPAQHTTPFLEGGIHAEAGSSVANCKFIRTMVHAPWPLLSVRTSAWVGNSFVWSNVLGSVQASYSATDAAELTLIGTDMETYGACWVQPAIQTTNVGATRLFGPHGRLKCHPQPNASVPVATAALALDTRDFWLTTPMSMPVTRSFNGEQPFTPSSDLALGPSLQRSLWLDRGEDAPWSISQDSKAQPALQLRVTSNTTVREGQRVVERAVPAEAQAALAAMVKVQSQRAGGPWLVATEPVPLPLLPPDVVAAAATAADDSETLQSMIDAFVTSDSPMVIPPGTYYIAKPLRVGRIPNPAGNITACLAIKRHRMLIGAGMDEVTIMATDPSMVMITIDGCYPAGTNLNLNLTSFKSESSRFHVSGVTLVGGAVGFHFTANTGHLQITESMVSHVRFRQIGRGIFLDDIFGLDNNLFSDLRFDECGVAFYQHPPDTQRVVPGGRCKQAFNNPYLGYMDKVVWFNVEVTNSDGGFHADACRADNLNYWIQNAMVNVTGEGWFLHDNSESAVVASLVQNVGSMTGAITVLGSQIVAGSNTQWLLPPVAVVEGSSFEVGADASGASLFPPSAAHATVSMTQSKIGKGLSLTSTLLRTSVLINNRFEEVADKALNVVGVTVNGSESVVLSAATSDVAPVSALLFGPAW